jgi:thioredoxin-like negative regulator of GroEL
LVLAVLTLSGLALAAVLAAPAPPSAIRWQADLEAALRAAKSTGKPVMVDFWAEWCGYCHELDRTTYRDDDVVRASRQFVSVKVNAEGSALEREAAARYLVRSLPTIAFLSPGGRQLLRVNGYVRPQQFPQVLAQALEAAAPVLAWESTLAEKPDDVAALVGLGLHVFGQVQDTSARDEGQLIPRRMLEDSRDLLARAVERDKGLPVVDRKNLRRTLALVLGADGKLEQTEALLQAALALTPPDRAQDSEASLSLGDLYRHQGKTPQAREVFEKIVKDYPNTRAGVRARQHLAQLGPG